MKKTFKRRLALFSAAFVITACVIIFAVSGILIEKNTGKMLGEGVRVPFALELKRQQATLTLSDREYTFSLRGLNKIATSKSSALVSIILLVL